MSDDRIALLVLDYGSPASTDEVAAYYTHIRRGRPPDPAALADLVSRYEAIGGISPLRARTEAQAAALAASCEAAEPGRYELVVGHKHAPPFIEDAVADAGARGLHRLVAVVLAPHFSAGSVGQYLERARVAARAVGGEVAAVDHWYDLPEYTDFLAGAVGEALAGLPPRTQVVFTAHALPLRVLAGDPYPDQLRDGAARIARAAHLDVRNSALPWCVAWQSAGRTPEPWIGPDIGEVIARTAAAGGVEGLLVVPHGFVADHLEVRYDLDIEAAGAAAEAGLAFGRTRVLGDDRRVLGALADRARGTAHAAWDR